MNEISRRVVVGVGGFAVWVIMAWSVSAFVTWNVDVWSGMDEWDGGARLLWLLGVVVMGAWNAGMSQLYFDRWIRGTER